MQNGGLVGDVAVGVGGVALKADAFARLNDNVLLISRDFDCTEKGDKLGGTPQMRLRLPMAAGSQLHIVDGELPVFIVRKKAVRRYIENYQKPDFDLAIQGILIRHLDRIAADVDGTLLPINVTPFQSAALAPPHPRGDDKLEVGFVLDALALQRGNDPLRRFLVRNLLFAFAPGVTIGAPSRIMRKKATLHGIREDAAQRSVHTLNGALGEWLFVSGRMTFRSSA